MKKWTTKGFEAFRRGKFGNGGHNIYVSRKGVLQRIHQTDVTRNGYMDLLFCNSQAHEEWVPVHVYSDPVYHPEKFTELDFGGAYDAVVAVFIYSAVYLLVTLVCDVVVGVIYFYGERSKNDGYFHS